MQSVEEVLGIDESYRDDFFTGGDVIVAIPNRREGPRKDGR